MPVIHVPAFKGPNGMPVGISLIGRRYYDQHLLSFAKVLSEALMADGTIDVKGRLEGLTSSITGTRLNAEKR
jgi:hypothetical protein